MKLVMVRTALSVAMLILPAALVGQHADEDGVRRAALDYLDGFYEGDTAKIHRGVHPDVTKYGFAMRGGDEYSGQPMSFQQMLDYATGVKERENYPDASAPKEVMILDVLDQTASAKVIAWWGTDYLHLARYGGQWKIIHVLWQTPSPGH